MQFIIFVFGDCQDVKHLTRVLLVLISVLKAVCHEMFMVYTYCEYSCSHLFFRLWPGVHRERYIDIASILRRADRVLTITHLGWHHVVLRHPPDRRTGIVYRVGNV